MQIINNKLLIGCFFLLLASMATTAQQLKELVKGHGMYIGAAVKPQLLDDQSYAKTLTTHFNMITPENHMKPSYVQPVRGSFTFFEADKIVVFAQKHGMKVRGHTLLWHEQNPGWLENGNYSRDELLTIMKDHIMNVAGHYRGKIYAWDVVNEAFDAGQLRKTFWYATIGLEYIDHAFHYAKQADPRAALILNDFDVEEICPKSDIMYRTVKSMRERGIPIDGVGFQCHLDIDKPPDFTSMYANFKRFADLGVAIELTEIDIRIKENTTPERLAYQAAIFGRLAELTLHFPACKVLTTWGLSDEHFEISFVDVKYGNGLLFGKNYKKKPAFDTLCAVLIKGPIPLAYEDRLEKQAAFKGRYIIPPFLAHKAVRPPVIDGHAGKKEWKDGYTYGFMYNQLNPENLRIPGSQKDLSGWWKVAYNKNQLFGIVKRFDDVVITGNTSPMNNDNVEVYVAVNDTFFHYTSVVDKSWESVPPGKNSNNAVWSKNGKLVEFIISLPIDDLEARIIGWNISLTDNDSRKNTKPEARIFPVNGTDKSREGVELGELFLSARIPHETDTRYIVPPFRAVKCQAVPEIDGIEEQNEWSDAVIYGFGYNQLSRYDKRPPKNSGDCSGDWRIVYAGNKLYGLVHRMDNWTIRVLPETYKNDNVELFIKTGDTFVQFRTLAGKDWEPHKSKFSRKAVWSKKEDVLEFMIELPYDDLTGKTIGWNIALSDNDLGGERKWQLYPVNGDNECWRNKDFAELRFE